MLRANLSLLILYLLYLSPSASVIAKWIAGVPTAHPAAIQLDVWMHYFIDGEISQASFCQKPKWRLEAGLLRQQLCRKTESAKRGETRSPLIC